MSVKKIILNKERKMLSKIKGLLRNIRDIERIRNDLSKHSQINQKQIFYQIQTGMNNTPPPPPPPPVWV
jgi:hypothetical protein